MVDYESEFTKNLFQLAEKANGASPKDEADEQHRQKVVERRKEHEESENQSVWKRRIWKQERASSGWSYPRCIYPVDGQIRNQVK